MRKYTVAALLFLMVMAVSQPALAGWEAGPWGGVRKIPGELIVSGRTSLGAGTSSTAPLKFTSGTLLATAEAGAIEFLADAYYGTITTGAARKTFAFLESPSLTTPNIGVATATSIAIGANTLDTNEWANIDGLNQTLATTSSPAFSNLDLATGGGLRTATAAGSALLLQAYDVDGAAYTTFGTLTANNTPTLDLATGVTIGSQYIYRIGGTDIAIADGGTGVGSWTNGQLLIGNTTGNTAALATLTGTTNQITVTNGASSITLAAPQDLATASTPQFARLGLGAAADATNILTATSASTTDLSKALNSTHTGAIVGTGYGGYFSKTGGSTTNVGLYATASGATNNYAAIFEAGNVGIGTLGPLAALHIKGSGTGASALNTLYFDLGGYDTPKAQNAALDGGVKLHLFSSGTQKLQVGMNSSAEMWFNNAGSSNDGFAFYTASDTTTAPTAKVKIQQGGNVGIGTTDGFGTSAVGVVSLGAGTAPTTSPANVTQAWTADINAVAGQAGLHMKDELGGVYKIGAGIMWGSNAEPTCAAGIRGTVNYVAGGAGVADTFRVCTKDVADAYAWRVIY